MTHPLVSGHSTGVVNAPATQLEPSARPCGQLRAELAPPTLEARLQEFYDTHAPTVWRTLRRLGVPERASPSM